jgi:hypothetical protein
MQKKKNMKPHQAEGAMKWPQLHVTHTMHDMSKKHSCLTNYRHFDVVNPIQIV